MEGKVVVAKNGLEDVDNTIVMMGGAGTVHYVEDLFDVIQWKALKEGKQMTRVMRKLEMRL